MNKFRLVLSLVWLLSVGLFSSTAIAQTTGGGVPPSFSLKKGKELSTRSHLDMPINFTQKDLLEEDDFNSQNGITRPRVAVNISSDINMDNSGEWSTLPDGRRVWRVAVEAKGAKAVILSYDEFYLPSGSQLFIYNQDQTHVLGAFNDKSNPRGGAYSTPFVAGDIVVLEYVAPRQESHDKPKIHISGVGYGYNHIYIVPDVYRSRLNPGASNRCQVNVICSPEGDLWQENSKSVCQITMFLNNNWFNCSGTLVNNTANDMTPYILSAFHCYDGATTEDLLKWQFNFFYRSTECAENKNYTANLETLTGAELIAYNPLRNAGDGLLLKLVKDIPTQWVKDNRIRWAGWDRRANPAVMAQSGVGIHHPAGDMQKISTYTSPARIVSKQDFGTSGITGKEAHWRVQFIETPNGWSATEGGSSGSGLINQNGLVIGTLSGGPPGFNCNTYTAYLNVSYYGTLAFHWDKYGNDATTQMKTWLDPIGKGVADTCRPLPFDGYDVQFTGFPQEIHVLKSVQFTGVVKNADSIKWKFEEGTPATSKEYRPLVTYNSPGKFDVELTVYTKNDRGEDTIIVNKIKDYVKASLKGKPQVPKAKVAALGVPKEMFSDNFANSQLGNQYKKEPNTNANVWAITNKGLGKHSILPAAHGYSGTGDNYLRYKSDKVGKKDRISRKFTVAKRDYLSLSFQMVIRRLSELTNNFVDTLFVEYRENPTDKWQVIYNSEGDYSSTGDSLAANWTNVNVPLPGTAALNFEIAFRASTSGKGYGIGIDDITILNSEILDTPQIWENEVLTFIDVSTGDPVLYKYNFEGGDPKTSESDEPTIDVRYANEGEYAVKQWVKNTLGDDEHTQTKVKVLKRELKTDKNEIEVNCAEQITDKIILTVNKNWKVTAPDWITLSASSGTVGTPGENEDITINISASANTGSVGRSTYLNFSTDDAVLSQLVRIVQPTASPTNFKAKTVDSVNVELNWRSVPGSFADPCILSVNGGGKFEDTILYKKHWTSFAEGDVDSTINPKGWFMPHASLGIRAYKGAGCVISPSYNPAHTSIPLNADNWLVTPQVKVTADNHELKYWLSSHDIRYADSCEVRLSFAENITSSADFTEILEPLAVVPAVWTGYSIDLKRFIGKNVFIAFRHKSRDKFILKIDNVVGLPLVNCGNEETGSDVNSSQPEMLSSRNAKILARKMPHKAETNDFSDDINLANREFANDLAFNKTQGNIVAKTSESFPIFDVSKLKQFKWCGEATPDAVGFGGRTFSVAAKWTSKDLKHITGTTLRAVEIMLNEMIDIELFIANGNVALHKQKVLAGTIPIGKPYVIELTKPIHIEEIEDEDVYIGYRILSEYISGPVGVDVGPPVEGKGNMIFIPETRRWQALTDVSSRMNFNWYIVAHGDGGGLGYNVYRKRTNEPDDAFRIVGANITDTTFVDTNVMPGGNYEYRVTYASGGPESCPSNEDAAFVFYQQTIDGTKLIKKIYGDSEFSLGSTEAGDTLVYSSAIKSDYFKGREKKIPLNIKVLDGDKDCIKFTENSGIYNISINKAGSVRLEASQAGIADTLLAAETVVIDLNISKKDLQLIAIDAEREEGEENPKFEYRFDGFAYGDDATNIANAANIIIRSDAMPHSPIGTYPIEITTVEDSNYNLIPNEGQLTVKRTSRDDLNIFTPYSSDGYNDYFMAGYRIKVFNRMGVLLYETKTELEEQEGWSGKVRNTAKLVEPGVYYYIIMNENGKVAGSGSITVVK